MTEPGILDKQTFHKFAQLIYTKCGITLGEKKEALVQARVGKRMRSLGLSDYQAYYEMVENDSTGEEVTALLDAISTNVTNFFREARHFEILGQLVKEWEAKGQSRFRIWCAASSTGEEPYSLSMTLRENLNDARDAKILATDISTRVLEKARQGVYEERHLETVPLAFQNKYFHRERHGESVMYRVDSSLQKMITFGRINLSTPPFPLKGPLDVVFCRNVMIYFDNQVRTRLLENLYRLLRPKGYLMVGHAESLSGMLSEFKSVEPSVYVKP
jgi:chemotaxis protein methyltransferase CheR